MSNHSPTSSPALFLNTVNAYQCTAAIRAAIELQIFTTISEGIESVKSLLLSYLKYTDFIKLSQF